MTDTDPSDLHAPAQLTDFTAVDWGGAGKGCWCVPVRGGELGEPFRVAGLQKLTEDDRVVRPVVIESSSESYDLRERRNFYRAARGYVLTVSSRATSSAMRRDGSAPKRGRTGGDETRELRDIAEARCIARRVLVGANLKVPTERVDPVYARLFDHVRCQIMRDRRRGWSMALRLRAAFPEASELFSSDSEFVPIVLCARRASSRKEFGRLMGAYEHGYPSIMRSTFTFKPFALGRRRSEQTHEEIKAERSERQRRMRRAYHIISRGKDTAESVTDTEPSDRELGGR